jgi:hypothetical protein
MKLVKENFFAQSFRKTNHTELMKLHINLSVLEYTRLAEGGTKLLFFSLIVPKIN